MIPSDSDSHDLPRTRYRASRGRFSARTVAKILIVMAMCLALFWLIRETLPRVVNTTLPIQIAGQLEFTHLPDDWQNRIEKRSATQAANDQRYPRVSCTPGNQPAMQAGHVVLSCSSVAARGDVDVFSFLHQTLGVFPSGASVRSAAYLTPYAWLNYMAFWWLPLPLLFLLLRGHGWRRDADSCWVFLRRRPWVPLLAGLLISVLPRITRWLGGGLFHSISPSIGWYAFAPIFIGPLMEELLFRGVMVRWLERAGLGSLWIALFTSLLFVLWHDSQIAENPARMVTLFLSGLIFFWVRHRSGSMLCAVLTHAIANAAVALY